MAVDSVAGFIAEVRQAQLVDAAQVDEMAKDAKGFTDPRVFAKHCLKKGWLTAFQINQLLLGAGNSLVMGQYRLLDRIGEGGMGQVYKARHQAMGRIVALKVIRKDRLENDKAIKRFRREIQVAAQLTHPNVVLAFDADAVNGLHFIAMEFVDGVDLSKLLKDKGALPVNVACDFIRQAALGLQHAHERGLVHRDIKPSNLLVSVPGASGPPPSSASSGVLRKGNKPQIKILDMGLARLMFDTDAASTGMTQIGLVVGTPDFMSPEQGKNSHLVDHRADIYSLGCTFYFLLANQVPYPGGTNIEKLVKHQMEQPKPIEQYRSDIPEGVGKILRRMMAKKPEERPQTGNEVASLLAPFCDPSAIKPGPGRDSKKMKLPAAELAVPPHRNTVWSRIKRRGSGLPGRRKLVIAGFLGVFLLGAAFLLLGGGGAGEPTRTGPTGLASTRITPGPTPPTTPQPTQPTSVEPKRPANVPHRFFPDATSLAVGFNVRDILTSRVGSNHANLRYWDGRLEQLTGLDLDVEVEHIVVCIALGDGGAQQLAFVFHGPFEKGRFAQAVAQRGGQLQGGYYALSGRSYLAMLAPSVIVWTAHENLMRNIVERGSRSNSLQDQAVQRGFEDWAWPGVRLVAGGTWPSGEGDRLGNRGLRHLSLEVTFPSDGATARLVAQADSASYAAQYRRQVPDWFTPLTSREDGYASILKTLLETQPSIASDHSVIWQMSLTRQEVAAYFYPPKLP